MNTTISKTDSLKRSLIGEWGGFGESKPIWKITNDSIYYYDQNKSYSYTITGTDFIINMNKSYPKLKDISVNKDTLFFYLPANVEESTYVLTKSFKYK